MKFSKPFTVSCCLFMSTVLSDVPSLAMATAKLPTKMIGTETVVEKLDRAQAQADLETFLHREDVKKALLERGVAPNEVSTRVASLSDSELRQLQAHIQTAQAGGDILVAILLVVLIIFLVKRI